MTLTADEQEALSLLEDWYRRLQEVLTLIEAEPSKAEIQEAYKAVKQELESEYRTRYREKQNEAGILWLRSTLQKAFTHLSARVNGQPDNIYISVLDAASDISHSIDVMRVVQKE